MLNEVCCLISAPDSVCILQANCLVGSQSEVVVAINQAEVTAVCMYVCMYVYFNECMYVCMHVCMYIYFNEWRSNRVLVQLKMNTMIGWFMYICMYACVCMYVIVQTVCMYMYVIVQYV